MAVRHSERLLMQSMSEPNLTHQTLGRYQLLVAIARGGMGQVWLARLQGARGFNKLVAVKTLLGGAGDARLEGMLLEEARIAALIQHANVVHTLELGEHEGTLYLAMEWVDGEPLSFLLERASERGGMPLEIAVALSSQVLAGLHAAHELHDHSGALGVVHRDVSPHNVLVTYDGVAKLLDFGIAKATQQSSSSTETGEIKGKFSYMAPEQILGADVDRRCDIFAAGIVLYLLSTGKHPFKHHNTAAVIHSITTDEPVRPPSTLNPDYPRALEAVLLKALEKDPERRWASAEDMRIALEQAMPEAFGDAGRARLRAFMDHTVGDRKVARREAIRRAQLAADARDVETGARKALQSSSGQSASSLRAISISTPAPAEASEIVSVGGSTELTPAVPKKKRKPRAPWIVAAVGTALALAVTLPGLLRAPAPSTVASAGVQAGAPIAARPAAAAAAAPVAPVRDASVSSAEPLSPPAPSASTERRPAQAVMRAKPKAAAKKAASTPPSSASSDLLVPDY
jgi:eukaryotic-like serine/threonine-protein kinase